jgi:hypothetical protein
MKLVGEMKTMCQIEEDCVKSIEQLKLPSLWFSAGFLLYSIWKNDQQVHLILQAVEENFDCWGYLLGVNQIDWVYD